MEQYHQIIFLQDYEDPTVDKFFEDDMTEEQMIDYLADWDYGSEMEHSPSETPSRGGADDWCRIEDYVLTWNRGLGYVGLERVTS